MSLKQNEILPGSVLASSVLLFDDTAVTVPGAPRLNATWQGYLNSGHTYVGPLSVFTNLPSLAHLGPIYIHIYIYTYI